ncbi:MAG: hypothetical protein A4E19_13820 [Nitrospira sp. SG-bin1]|nr:MAG: hypothetical protein A4E19_13820 [Nitrospira sp. SG-bin1]
MFHRTVMSRYGHGFIALFLSCALYGEPFASTNGEEGSPRERIIPILGVTISGGGQPIGTVTSLTLTFQERTDHRGLMVSFLRGPGKLSPMAQTSIQQAIYRAASAAGLSTDAWTVTIAVPQPVTIYGDSLSAMVGLTVTALAKHDSIMDDRIITGGIAPDGHISKTGGLSYKLAAANAAHIRRVLVPDVLDPEEAEWQTPFLMHVSPVESVQQAYQVLTGNPIQ